MKRIISKIKYYWKKLKDFFRPIKYTNEQVFEHLFNHICLTQPRFYTSQCLCGCILTSQNITEKQYDDKHVWILWDCPKCFIRSEKRYTYDMKEL